MSAMLKRILVAVDGSDAADKAVALAVNLGRTYGSELLFLHVLDDFVSSLDTAPGVTDLLSARGGQLLTKAAHQAEAAGVASKSILRSGRPETLIVEAAATEGASAIVMGTHGREGIGRFFVGSTAEGVLRIATVPVFVAHAETVPSGRMERIVVGVDNSDPSDEAAQFATGLAIGAGLRANFCHVVDENTLFEEAANFGGEIAPVLEEWTIEANVLAQQAARRASGGGLSSVETTVVTGDPTKELFAVADRQNADLIVVGAHGRRGRRPMLAGSVMLNLVRRSSRPVVVVRNAPAPTGSALERSELAASMHA